MVEWAADMLEEKKRARDFLVQCLEDKVNGDGNYQLLNIFKSCPEGFESYT